MGERAPAAGESKQHLRLIVNGESCIVAAGLTVHGFLQSLGLVPAMIVVERNLEILDRDWYDTTVLVSGDRLELVHFVGGG
jgi:thiamine biosynthesis protein ThiS